LRNMHLDLEQQPGDLERHRQQLHGALFMWRCSWWGWIIRRANVDC
jgi:hypothetical protein